ncbi:VCBS repeat-containing protein, partial [Fulvivirga sp. RKSG066]|uniref:FG-GAP repeat domain-containing protein n=1 Tax=Fulvivirga aurantia TaxID=2529383 RepID=UPI001624A07E
LDNDGDLDMMATSIGGNYYYHENTGTSTAPAFGPEQANPFGLVNNGQAYSWGLSFADLDNDGDLDMIAGENSGSFYYYQNIGTATAPNFAAAQVNPFGITSVPTNYGYPKLVDLDSDGDLDLLSGGSNASWYYMENIGTSSSPAFSTIQTNPFNLTNSGFNYSIPGIADLDGDGDLDILSGDNYGTWSYFQNDGTACSLEMAQTATVTIDPIADQTVAAAETSFICAGETTIDLASSEVGVDYYLRN